MKPLQITILLPDLRGGGAERLSVNLANHWRANGYIVEIVLLSKAGELLPLVDPSIPIVNFSVKRLRSSFLPFFHYLKERRPTVIWVGMWPLTSIALLAWALSGRIGHIFVTDHNHLSESARHELKVPTWLIGIILSITYRFATAISAVSNGVASDLCRLGHFPPVKIKTIYNPAAFWSKRELIPTENTNKLWRIRNGFRIISIGALKYQKNHELLIRAFAKLSPDIDAELIILGEGELRPGLEELIDNLKLRGRISMPGFQLDVYPWLISSNLFVLSSRWEGFGNVLVEALQCGLKVVSTNCQSGPAEILVNGQFGRLVPVNDIDALASAMRESFVETVSEHALINRANDFTVERISEQYLQFFRAHGSRI